MLGSLQALKIRKSSSLTRNAENASEVDPSIPYSPQRHQQLSTAYSSEFNSSMPRVKPSLLLKNRASAPVPVQAVQSPSLPWTARTHSTRTLNALSLTDTVHTRTQTAAAPKSPVKTSFARAELRHKNSIYECIISPTEDAGYSVADMFSAATSDCDFRSRGTPYSGTYSPDSALFAGGSQHPYRRKRARSESGFKNKNRESRPRGDGRPDPKRRKNDPRSKQHRERKSDIFIDIDDVVQDFLWEQKFKAECDTFSRCVNPKFFTLEFPNDSHFACQQQTSALRDINDVVVQDSWAMSSLFDPIKDTAAIDVDKDDAILNSASLLGIVDDAQKEKEQIAIGDKEALFLRRTLLISNDLYTDGVSYKHGIQGAEKALVRSAPPQLETNEIAKRIDATFEQVKQRSQHPNKPGLKIKRVMPLLPNRDLWVHPYSQVKYDEPPTLPNLQKVPPVLVKATVSPYITAFAVYQYGDAEQAHVIDRSYVWDNQGECSMMQNSEFRLLEWPAFSPSEENTSRPVLFSQVSNKIRLRKLTARVPKQRKIYEAQLFGSKAIHIEWRNPTNEDADQEAEAAKYMFE
eukprot:GEMP01006078.1.p1 GENE.GEMP01006078.1~~GEMP01006078.1.p1  ORF type:complete len:596 (+),score=100.74 GEMP01006078.1:61-1788(+)